MVIMHNMMAMNANRMLNINNRKQSSVTEKLASGYRINRAADDAAGLAISEKMRKQIRGLTQGVQNTKEGVSLCQVADGALTEVNDMLHRITELSVQAANGTLTDMDRQHIQAEIRELLTEIDRVGDTTKFNDQPIFKGMDEVILTESGETASFGSLTYDDFKLVDVDLGKTPLMSGESGNRLHLQAVVNKSDSVLYGKTFNLIYGSGSTSLSTFRFKDSNNQEFKIHMENMTQTDYNYNSANNEWTKEFSYSTGTGAVLKVTQKIKLDENNPNKPNEKNYIISYDFSQSTGIDDLEFMFHADTAYNNNDYCEGYFIDGNRVEKYSVYNNSQSSQHITDSTKAKQEIPNSFSIIDIDNALAFSEKISFEDDEKPDSLSIGHYSQIWDWDYYDSASLNTTLEESALQKDLGFSLYYNLGNLSTKNAVTFNYGIVNTQTDDNIKNTTLKQDTKEVIEHYAYNSVWIQSGDEEGSGMYVTIGELSTAVLGIHEVDVSTAEGAGEAIEAVKDALQKLSSNRATIGAQQNRLEHIIANEENIIENTTSAESRIRDTDMASVMVEYSNMNILLQAGQAMLAQANQTKNSVLSLLQQ